MSAEDPIEDGMAVVMNVTAATSRVAEVLLRQVQDLKVKQAHEAKAAVAEAATQLAARAEVAEAFYREAATQEWVKGASSADLRAAVQGVHLWAEVDPERFEGAAEKMHEVLQGVYGVDVREAYVEKQNAAAIADLAVSGVEDARRDESGAKPMVVMDVAPDPAGSPYDAPEARRERESAMVAAGVDQELVTARVVSDRLNAESPAMAAASAGSVKTKPAARRRTQTKGQQRGR